MNNLIEKKDVKSQFQEEGIKFTISSRGIRRDVDIVDYLKIFFPYISMQDVESLFGFVDEFSPFYGGRNYNELYALTLSHLKNMEKNNISLSLTLTNHHFSEEEYKKSLPFLEKYHKEGNSIVCTNDTLAKKIKKDFPKYKLKASLIKELNTLQKVIKALEIYDYVVIPMDLNDDDKFLESLPSKDRIVLFANANCAYSCKSRICYKSISDKIIDKERKSDISCSQEILPRLDHGHVFFNIKKLHKMGFSNFKLVPQLNETSLSIARKFSNSKNYFLNSIKKSKELIFLNSFPKSGRTWVRFMLANYINEMYDLNMNITLQNLFELMPNDYINDDIKSLTRYRYFKDNRFPCIISSHNKPDKYISFGRQIFLLRLVYDVIVSDYFQQCNLLNSYDRDISDFIKEENGSVERYCNYINNLAEVLNDKTDIFTYEMLHENIYETMKNLIKFLNIELNEKFLLKAIENSSFENMSKIEEENGLAGFYDKAPKSQNSRRVREGKINNFKKYLSEEDILYISKKCDELLTNKAKEILRSFNI